MKDNQNMCKSKKGMTMVEIIVVLVILAIMAALAVPSLSGFLVEAQTKDCKARQSDVAEQYINTLVDQSYANPGGTISTQILEDDVLAKKGQVLSEEEKNTLSEETKAVLDAKSPEGTWYQGICETGGIYYARSEEDKDNPEDSILYVGCTQHGETQVTSGSIKPTPVVPVPSPVVSKIVTIQVSPAPKYWYEKNETQLDLTGGSLLLTYDDAHTASVSMTDARVSCTGFVSDKIGKQTITVHYEGTNVTGTFTIEVREPTITAISVKTPPTRTDYPLNTMEALSVDGGVITMTYSDGHTEDVNLPDAQDRFTFTGYNSARLGKDTITVTLKETNITASFEVNIIPAICRIVHSDGSITYYSTEEATGAREEVQKAINAVQSGETIEMLVPNVAIDTALTISKGKTFTLTTAGIISDLTQTTFTLGGNGQAVFSFAEGAGTVANITFSNIKLTMDSALTSGRGIDNGKGGAAITLTDVVITGFKEVDGCAVYSDGTLSMNGATQITHNATESDKSAVYVDSDAKNAFTVSGAVQVTSNGSKSVYLTAKSQVTIAGDLTSTANIGITAENRMEIGNQFGMTTAEDATTIKGLDRLRNDSLSQDIYPVYGVAGGGNKVIWDDGNVCRIQKINLTGVGKSINYYKTLSAAVGVAISGETIEMVVPEYNFDETQIIAKNLTITTAEDRVEGRSELIYKHTVNNQNNANMFKVTAGNITFNSIVLRSSDDGTGRGISYETAGNLSLINARITGFKATAGNLKAGGAIHMNKDNANLVMDSTEIDHCGGQQLTHGGAIYIVHKTAANITIKGNSSIHDCSARWGGVISSAADNGKENKIIIEGNTEIYHNLCYGDDTTTENCFGLISIRGNKGIMIIKDDVKIYGNDDGVSGKTLAILHPFAGATLNLEGNAAIYSNAIKGCYRDAFSGYSLITGSNTTAYTVNVKDSVDIRNNTVQNGAAVLAVESEVPTGDRNGVVQIVNMSGGIIEDNVGSLGGIYVDNEKNSHLNIEGRPHIEGNTDTDGNALNLNLTDTNNCSITGNLTEGASIAVTAEGRMDVGDQFGVTTNTATSYNGLEAFHQDCASQDESIRILGAAGEGKTVVWQEYYDGNFLLIHEETKTGYETLEQAFDASVDGDEIQMLVDSYEMPEEITIKKAVTLTKASNLSAAPTLTIAGENNKDSLFNVKASSVTFKGVQLSGSNHGNIRAFELSSDNGGLTLEDVVISGFVGKQGPAIATTNGGTITLKGQTNISGCSAGEGDSGGAIYAKKANITLQDYVKINGCSGKNGSAIYGEDTSINLSGFVQITENTASGSGAVFVDKDSTTTFKDNIVVRDNNNSIEHAETECNVYIEAYAPTKAVQVIGDLTSAATIGLTFGTEEINVQNAVFGETSVEGVTQAIGVARLDRVVSDGDRALMGNANSRTGGAAISWLSTQESVAGKKDNGVAYGLEGVSQIIYKNTDIKTDNMDSISISYTNPTENRITRLYNLCSAGTKQFLDGRTWLVRPTDKKCVICFTEKYYGLSGSNGNVKLYRYTYTYDTTDTGTGSGILECVQQSESKASVGTDGKITDATGSMNWQRIDEFGYTNPGE